MENAAPAPEMDLDTPYIGASSSFEDLDEMTPEEQALYDSEMNGEVDTPATPEPPPAAEPEEEFVPDEEPVETVDEADQAELEAENVPHGSADPSSKVEETPEIPAPTPSIPKARLDREIAKRRELEQRLAELESSKKVEAAIEEKEIDFSGAIDMEAITKALDMNLDGKNSEAAAIIAEQLQNAVKFGSAATRDQLKELVTASQEAAINQAVGQVSQQSVRAQFEATVTEIEQSYDVFNPDNAAYDAELVDRANSMRRALEADGLNPAEALKEAVELTVMRHRPELLKKAESAEPAAPAVNQPNAETRKRNAQAAAAQPSRGVGQPNTQENSRIDLERLTEEEFDALPDSVLAELRGDLM